MFIKYTLGLLEGLEHASDLYLNLWDIVTFPFLYFEWVTSAVWAADAVEIMLLGFLIPELKDKWDLSDVAAGSVAASVFFGMVNPLFCY